MLMATLGVGASVFAITSGLASGTPTPVSPALEMDISGNGSNLTIGEPEIAVNPNNPNQLYLDGAIFPTPTLLNGTSPVPNTCGGWGSDNGGLSWQQRPLTIGTCEDGEAVYGPNGTLYAGGDVATSTTVFPVQLPPSPPCPAGAIQFEGVCILVQGYDPVLMSTDGGVTWTNKVIYMGSNSTPATTLTPPFHFVPGSGTPINTFDRPWLAVDQSTGIVYAAGHNIADHQGFVTALTPALQPVDQPDTGAIYALDSPTYPSGGLFGGNIAAANGVLAAVYTAVPATGGCQATCLIFETSTDYGATFTRHVVPTMNAAAMPRAFVAADPTGRGGFAVTILDSTGTMNQVYTTSDFGQTWQGPTTVGETPAGPTFKPWIAYGPSGQLALVWRTFHTDAQTCPSFSTTHNPATCPYDVWAAVGRDKGQNGAVFSPPLRVTTPGVPAAAYPVTGSAGDDFSFIIATNKDVHVGWGDSRDLPFEGSTQPLLTGGGGGVQMWYSRIPLTAFGSATGG
jgi:hypothetical protein